MGNFSSSFYSAGFVFLWFFVLFVFVLWGNCRPLTSGFWFKADSERCHEQQWLSQALYKQFRVGTTRWVATSPQIHPIYRVKYQFLAYLCYVRWMGVSWCRLFRNFILTLWYSKSTKVKLSLVLCIRSMIFGTRNHGDGSCFDVRSPTKSRIIFAKIFFFL